MNLQIYQVDAFADEKFTGNPAAVCILDEPMDDAWMQNVAQEMNLSETAFLLRQDDGFQLRWFTPAMEVELCGHATLASAHILWETGYLYLGEEARFHTLSGLLTVRRLENNIEMDFPAVQVEQAMVPPGLLDALGVEPLFVGKNRFDYLIEVADASTVRAVQPDFGALGKVDARGVIVASRSDREEYDFISRFFAPAAGVNEDPVTGSAHCALGPYWAARLDKLELVAYQASARGGVVWIQVNGDRVLLGGRAVTVFRGEFV
jgi:PhzF family phenazine biosynthesis protein